MPHPRGLAPLRFMLLVLLASTVWPRQPPGQDQADPPPRDELRDPINDQVTTIQSARATRVDVGRGRHLTVMAPVPVRGKIDRNAMIVERENFDRWLFVWARTEEERWSYLNQRLDVRLGAVALERRLSDPQRAKLLLAGRGDIKRFLDRADEDRRDFEESRMNFEMSLTVLNRVMDQHYLNFMDGPFGEGSLFAKTLSRIEADRK